LAHIFTQLSQDFENADIWLGFPSTFNFWETMEYTHNTLQRALERLGIQFEPRNKDTT